LYVLGSESSQQLSFTLKIGHFTTDCRESTSLLLGDGTGRLTARAMLTIDSLPLPWLQSNTAYVVTEARSNAEVESSVDGEGGMVKKVGEDDVCRVSAGINCLNFAELLLRLAVSQRSLVSE